MAGAARIVDVILSAVVRKNKYGLKITVCSGEGAMNHRWLVCDILFSHLFFFFLSCSKKQ